MNKDYARGIVAGAAAVLVVWSALFSITHWSDCRREHSALYCVVMGR